MLPVFALALFMFSGQTDVGNVSSSPCAESCNERSMQVAQVDPGGASASAPVQSLSNPSVGVGLAGVTDYASQLPFLDLMKTARPWAGHVGGGWGGMEYPELKERGYLDQHGWPTSVPPGVSGISTLILTDLPAEQVSANGRYRLRYDGQGAIEISTPAGKVFPSRGEAWFTAEVGQGSAIIITIIRTDPNGIGEYLRNFTIVKEENIPAFEAGQIFNPLWIDRIKDMRVLRFMDWMNTNNSLESKWEDRPMVDDFTYGNHGVPLEIMIRLANEVGADPWFNIPHLATDDYIRQFATTVRDTLDSRLKAHVELSNEVWNWQFAQAKWAEENGLARWGQESKWVQYYALRASQMASIWDDVYAGQDQRLLKIIATQTGWEGLEEDILTAPMWTAEASTNRAPYTFFDAYGVTGYFSGHLGDAKADTVLKWLAESRAEAEAGSLELADQAARARYVQEHQYDLAIKRAAQELRNGEVTGDAEDTVQAAVGHLFPYHAQVAKKYGLDLIMYEGGTHVVGIGDRLEDQELAAFFSVLNYSEEMGLLYAELMDGWKASGGTLFNAFTDVYPAGRWGSWGALRHLDDDNPRWNAIQQFNAQHPAWWESRALGTFTPEAR